MTPEWLENSVFYQIYPQSFYDSNGDGIGDLPGILQKLDYVESLGCNAIWLNPCFVSPFGDAGYDVSDFYQVAPRYGSNEDLRLLFQEAERRQIRIILDLVVGHTSIEHPWFVESCKHSPNTCSDWFIWTDSAYTPPMPGLENVRGYSEREGTFIVNYFYMQPALNHGFGVPDPSHPWQQPLDAPGPSAVRAEVKKIMKYWLDMGATGFRVDMAASMVKNDTDKRFNVAFWQDIRAWLDKEYPHACLVSEWGNPAQAIQAGFHIDLLIQHASRAYNALFMKATSPQKFGGDRYGWSFFDRAGHGNIREFMDEYLHHYNTTRRVGAISIPSGNHDIFPRLATDRNVDDLKVIFTFLLTMPGVPFIYYGDEIGMRGVAGLPSKEGGYGRTGARTPMQWDHSKNAGFSTANQDQLYLPIEADPAHSTVAAQDADEDSLLNHVRYLNKLRRSHPALGASGNFEVIYAKPGQYPLVYKRTCQKKTIIVAINPNQQPAEICLDELVGATPTTLHGESHFLTQEKDGYLLKLPGVCSAVLEI